MLFLCRYNTEYIMCIRYYQNEKKYIAENTLYKLLNRTPKTHNISHILKHFVDV